MSLRSKFTDNEIMDAVECSGNNLTQAARDLTSLERGKVSRQILTYWLHSMGPVADSIVDEVNFQKTEQQKRTAQVENNRLRKITRDVLDAERTKDEVLQGIQNAVYQLKEAPTVPIVTPKISAKGKPMTAEILMSDLQIGKLMDSYNTDIAIRRLKEYAEVILAKIQQHIYTGYKLERIVLGVIGDIIESDKKHPNSARATDSGTAKQMRDATSYVCKLVLQPLACIGIPMDVVCVTGNHDHDGHGLAMFKPGREHLSWPMFHAWKDIVEAWGYDHVNFIIPEGAFHVHDIYGYKVLYEHGVGVKADAPSMAKRRHQRSSQIRQYITFFRMGDKHNVCVFNNYTDVVNGAFFGDDRTGSEYSGIVGYDGYPAQLMFFHVPRKDNYRHSMFDTVSIQLGHIF